MPVGSEPAAGSLPVRFRPLGVRLMAGVLTVVVVGLMVVIWSQFSDEVRASVTLVQRLTVLVFVLLIAALIYALVRCRVDADVSGVTVVNGYRTRHYAWGQLVAVTLRAGNPWAVLDLSDGTSQAALGIQGSDGARARAQVRRLRALIDAHAATEPPRRAG